MKNDLERDLGLYATVTISMGAMIGSGIFVLPALGLKKPDQQSFSPIF